MLQMIEQLSVTNILGIIAAITVGAVLIYLLARWLGGRRANSAPPPESTRSDVGSIGTAAPRTDMARDPRTLAKVRVGREGNRPSEDDILRERMGPRGRPGEASPNPAVDENLTQIPKGLDPGHTA